jgi:hypothetical protein
MMSGEMGRSIFRHPASYLRLMAKYRGSLADSKANHVKMGVALHWNKVRGGGGGRCSQMSVRRRRRRCCGWCRVLWNKCLCILLHGVQERRYA